MSTATFSRVHNWASEVLTAADLNAEFDNILNNLNPAGIGSYSDTIAQMQLTVSPGATGTESLATSLAGEIQRLRFTIQQIKGSGAAQWYDAAATSLTDLSNAIGGGLIPNRIVSGALSSNSNASRFLIPSGSTTSMTMACASTNLVYFVNNAQYSITSNVVIANLTVAPASNNTCIVDDGFLAAQEASKWQGEDGSVITIKTTGSNISNLAGSYGAFKHSAGGNTEYFIGYVNSATQLTDCYRGCFFTSGLATNPRLTMTNSETISLLQLTWVFANTAGSAAVSYVNPSVSYSAPSATSGYWFDVANKQWKVYNGSGWTPSGSTLIGMSAQDGTACIAARSFNFYAQYDSFANIVLDYNNTSSVVSRNLGGKIGVGNSVINFSTTKPVWDFNVNMESGVTVAASTTYFAYVGENGQVIISPHKPYYGFDLQRGWYHPYEVWRAVGRFKTDSTPTIVPSTLLTLNNVNNTSEPSFDSSEMRNLGLSMGVAGATRVFTICATDGTDLSPGNPAYVTFRNDNATSAVVARRILSSNISITQPVGASLGITANLDQYIWAYLIDMAASVDVGLCAQVPFQENTVGPTTTQISAGATSKGVIYSNGAGGTGRGVRLAARIKLNENNPGTPAGGNTISEVTLRPQLVYNIEDWSTTRAIGANTAAFVSIAAQNTYSRRIGDSLEVRLNFSCSSTGASPMQFTMPSGVQIDANKLNGPQGLGNWFSLNGQNASDFFGTTYASGVVSTSGAQTSLFYLAAAGINGQVPAALGNNMPGASQSIVLFCTLPILGWTAYGP